MAGGFDHSGSPEKSPIFQSKRSFHRIHPRPSRKFAGRSLFRPRYPEPQGWPRGEGRVKARVDVRGTQTMRRSFRTRGMLPGGFPGLAPLGWYAMPAQGMEFETGTTLDTSAKSAARTLIGHRPRTSRTLSNTCHAKPPRPLTSPTSLPSHSIPSLSVPFPLGMSFYILPHATTA